MTEGEIQLVLQEVFPNARPAQIRAAAIRLSPPPLLQTPSWSWDFQQGRLAAAAGYVDLSPFETLIFDTVARAAPRYAPMETILRTVYGGNPRPHGNTVQALMWRIRRKVAPLGVEIETITGRGRGGYRVRT